MIHNISRYLLTLALLLTAATGAWAQDDIQTITIAQFLEAPVSDTKYELTGTVENIVETTYGNFDLSDDNGKKVYIYGLLTSEGTAKQFASMGIKEGDNITIIATRSEYNGVPQAKNAILKSINPKGPEVTINDTKTEASFEMPTSDVTIDYELVRDMSVQMQAQVGDDPAKEPRYRVQRNGESWVPADLNLQQVLALFSLKDLIEDKTLNLTSFNDSIYAVDAEGNPIGDAMTFQNFTFAPGRYCVTVSAQLDAPYEGTTAPSNIFELYKGYEVTVGAGEYATFYKDENLYTEDEDAELYTISSVSDTEAVLSDKLAMVAANTPMLVYNKGTEAKTFILLPSLKEDADEVTVAREFRGTLAEKEMPASSTTVDYYVCTGKAFEWVRDAGVIAANKCWLQIGDQPAAARAMTRSIVGGGNTTNMDDVRWQMEDGNYYDLQGRKVEKPNRKGIYIHNGKKVIVR